MRNLKFVLFGLVLGLFISSSVALAEPIKQFILTQSNVPIFVNGKEYTPKNPLLNLNGVTYAPLKELGDVLKTKVEWNDKEKRIEVGESKATAVSESLERLQMDKIIEVAGIKYTFGFGTNFFYDKNTKKYFTDSIPYLLAIINGNFKTVDQNQNSHIIRMPNVDNYFTSNEKHFSFKHNEMNVNVLKEDVQSLSTTYLFDISEIFNKLNIKIEITHDKELFIRI